MEPVNLLRWRRPQHYIGADWPEYYVFVTRNRDSDVLERANWNAAVRALEKLSPEQEDRWLIVTENHFLCGWIEWVGIHESWDEGLALADSIGDQLADYPILDEEEFSNLEYEEATDVWENGFDWKDRVKFLRDHGWDKVKFVDLLWTVRGKSLVAVREYSILAE